MLREEVLKLAEECGFSHGCSHYPMDCDIDRMETFYQAAYLAGAKAMQEKAAKVCDTQYKVMEARKSHAEGTLGGANYAYFVPAMGNIAECASAIRAITHENLT